MRRRSGGVGWNTSVEPARLTNAVRMSDCLIMTTTLPFADMFPCGTDHGEIRACTEPGSKDALPLTVAQNVVRYKGCGFALVADGCHAAFGNARYRSRPISVRDSRPSFSATRQRRIKYATSRARKCFAFEIPRPIRRMVTSSCRLSGALRPRSMACPKLMFGGKLGRKSAASHRSVRIRTVAFPLSPVVA